MMLEATETARARAEARAEKLAVEVQTCKAASGGMTDVGRELARMVGQTDSIKHSNRLINLRVRIPVRFTRRVLAY